MVLAEDKIAFIDFGEMGSLSENRLVNLGRFLQGIDKKNVDRAMSALFDMGIMNDRIDLDDFEGEFADVVERIYSSNIGGIDMNLLRKEILSLTYRYKLRLPSYFSALMKALITLEGVGKKLDPAFNISEVTEPIIQRMFTEKSKPDEVFKTLQRSYYRNIKPLLSFPRNLNNLVKEAAQGDLEITHNIALEQHLDDRISQLTNRISASLIIAGGLVSTSLLLLGSQHSAYLNDVLIGTSVGISLIGLYALLKSQKNAISETHI